MLGLFLDQSLQAMLGGPASLAQHNKAGLGFGWVAQATFHLQLQLHVAAMQQWPPPPLGFATGLEPR